MYFMLIELQHYIVYIPILYSALYCASCIRCSNTLMCIICSELLLILYVNAWFSQLYKLTCMYVYEYLHVELHTYKTTYVGVRVCMSVFWYVVRLEALGIWATLLLLPNTNAYLYTQTYADANPVWDVLTLSC